VTLYVRNDLHATNGVVVRLDAQDHVLYQKRLCNDLRLILVAGPYRATLHGITLEFTYNWY
jgi:hypothetical protein